MDPSESRIEVISVPRPGGRTSWAVMANGRQAVVVNREEAAVQIAGELAKHPVSASPSRSDESVAPDAMPDEPPSRDGRRV